MIRGKVSGTKCFSFFVLFCFAFVCLFFYSFVHAGGGGECHFLLLNYISISFGDTLETLMFQGSYLSDFDSAEKLLVLFSRGKIQAMCIPPLGARRHVLVQSSLLSTFSIAAHNVSQ